MIKELYVRFGKIPENEKSGIYNGDEGKVGEEKGVSCYHAVISGNKVYCLLSIKEMYDSCVYYCAENAVDGYKWVKNSKTDSVKTDDDAEVHKEPFHTYLITGDEVGKGSSGEPLLKSVRKIYDLEVKDGELYIKSVEIFRMIRESSV